MNGTVKRNAIALRRACSTLTRVARVSRSIGNSDSTGKPYPWQVAVLGGSVFGNSCGKAGLRRKRHSILEWRLNALALVTGLRPNGE